MTITALTSLGTTTAYVELCAEVEGSQVKLSATGIEYCPRTGMNRETALGELTVESEEAEDAGSDLQGMAHDWLDAMGKERGWFWKGMNFSQAAFNFVYA